MLALPLSHSRLMNYLSDCNRGRHYQSYCVFKYAKEEALVALHYQRIMAGCLHLIHISKTIYNISKLYLLLSMMCPFWNCYYESHSCSRKICPIPFVTGWHYWLYPLHLTRTVHADSSSDNVCFRCLISCSSAGNTQPLWVPLPVLVQFTHPLGLFFTVRVSLRSLGRVDWQAATWLPCRCSATQPDCFT